MSESRKASLRKQATIETLSNFDSLPDEANARLPVVAALYGCSPASVWRMVKRKTIPAPRKLSERITVWNVGELRRALAEKSAA